MTRAECLSLIMDQYARQRRLNEEDRTARVEHAVRMDPAIGVLLDTNGRLFYGSAARLLGFESSEKIVKDMREKAFQNQQAIKERLLKLNLPEDELELRYHCASCKDTGYVGALQNQMCECVKSKLAALSFDEPAMTELSEQNFDAFDLSIFPDEIMSGEAISQREAMRRVKGFIMKYADDYPNTAKQNLVLMGDSGLGKTYLLDCIAERVLKRSKAAVRITAFRMLEAMRRHHFGEQDEMGSFEVLLGAELLLIDDLGTEPLMRNITIEYLFTLLNERMAAKRHTVVATNLKMSEIRARYNERVASRLFDHTRADIIVLNGRDLRQRNLP